MVLTARTICPCIFSSLIIILMIGKGNYTNETDQCFKERRSVDILGLIMEVEDTEKFYHSLELKLDDIWHHRALFLSLLHRHLTS